MRFWCYRPISASKVYLHVSVLAKYNLKCCFKCFFDYLNVNFQLLFSQFNNWAYGYNDVGLIKHAQVSVTWYGKQHMSHAFSMIS